MISSICLLSYFDYTKGCYVIGIIKERNLILIEYSGFRQLS